MPTRPPTFRPGGITPKQTQQAYDRQRGTSTQRGYDARWRRYRERFLTLPENVYCACGCGEPSTVVDHIVPATGPNDPTFFDEENHQGLAVACHNKKTASGNVWMGMAPEFVERRARVRGEA